MTRAYIQLQEDRASAVDACTALLLFASPMKRLLSILFLSCLPLLAAHAVSADSMRVDTLAYHGRHAIDFVLLGDGYTRADQAQFLRDARRCFGYLFHTSPFDRYRSYFNLYAIAVVSRERGISHPGVRLPDGTRACPEHSPLPLQQRDTYFRLSLDLDGIHRLMGCGNYRGLRRILHRCAPRCHLAGILSNTDEYGGMGGDILLATRNRQSREVFVHEFAHMFGNLADEYFAGDDFFDELPNMTHDSQPTTVRWRRWLDEPGVGIYPYQGTPEAARWYKPTEATQGGAYCKMQVLGRAFCPVCREALVERLHELCNPIGAVTSADSVLAFPPGRHSSLRFRLAELLEARGGHTLIVWRVDGRVAQVGGKRFRLRRPRAGEPAPHTVSVSVSDESEFVRSPEHALRHVYKHTWQIV